MNGELNKYRSLLQLSRSEKLLGGDHSEFIKETLVTLAEELDVSRASFWYWSEIQDSITNECLFIKDTKKFESGEVLQRNDYPQYFEAFRNNLLINAPDAYNDERTCEFKASYLDHHEIKSLLDVQVTARGKLYGVICLEQTKQQRSWSQVDELFLISAASYIAQSYAAMLRKESENLRIQSELNYKSLFFDSPIPMWVYDHETFKFLAVNNSAVQQYGFTEKEFLNMSIKDIRPNDEKNRLENHLMKFGHRKWHSEPWVHQYKNGQLVNVNIASDWTLYNGKKVRIVMAHNVTEEVEIKIQMEDYISKLTDFARYASHNLRGPVARLMGLYNILNLEGNSAENREDIIKNMLDTTLEIDSVIHILNKKL